MVLDDQTRKELLSLVKEAVSSAVIESPLSADEVHWVRMAIKAEAERAELRNAIINKTLAGLALMFAVFVCGLIWSGLKDHIK